MVVIEGVKLDDVGVVYLLQDFDLVHYRIEVPKDAVLGNGLDGKLEVRI